MTRWATTIEIPTFVLDGEIESMVETIRGRAYPRLQITFEGTRAEAEEARDDLNTELRARGWDAIPVLPRGRP